MKCITPAKSSESNLIQNGISLKINIYTQSHTINKLSEEFHVGNCSKLLNESVLYICSRIRSQFHIYASTNIFFF